MAPPASVIVRHHLHPAHECVLGHASHANIWWRAPINFGRRQPPTRTWVLTPVRCPVSVVIQRPVASLPPLPNLQGLLQRSKRLTLWGKTPTLRTVGVLTQQFVGAACGGMLAANPGPQEGGCGRTEPHSHSCALVHCMEDRCLVAPHPTVRKHLLEKYNEIKDRLGDDPEVAFLRELLRPIERRPPGFNDGLKRPGNTFRPGMSFAAQLAEKKLLRGDVNVIVVMVDFPDKEFTETQNQELYRKLWFEEGANSVKDYFKDVSNGLVDIKGEVVGPYRMPEPISHYANGASGIGTRSPNARTMARDATILANPNVSFAKYDNDGDGFVDAYVIVHAGEGAETTGNVNDIWSHKGNLPGNPYQADGTQIYAYLTVPANCQLGVCAHELGHLAFDWPDLYDADYSSWGIGDWCLMGSGSYNGNQDNPSPPSAWCKAAQGWVEVVTPTETQQVTLEDVKTSHRVVKLWKDGAPEWEYFLVENRQQQGRDKDLPASGLLVWHIDERKLDNSSENTHYKVGLMQSDGRKDLERKEDQGDRGDPFPGSRNVRLINSTTKPSTRAHNGAPTGVSISDISDSADVMTFTVSVSDAPPAAVAR